MARILIVEDDGAFRSALKDYLVTKKHHVNEAPNGKVGREIISSVELDLVICDVQMPFLNGVELLEWVKSHKPVPFILMTGFTNLIETQKAAELGADGFLAKPFRNIELLEMIEELIKRPEDCDKPMVRHSDFCKVSIEEFVARPKVEFDVYVRLSEHKYLKVAHKGQLLDVNRIQVYKEKGMNFLYIHKDDFGKLVDFNLQVAELLKRNPAVPLEKRLSFLKYTGEVILEQCFVNGVSREAFDDAKEYFNTTINILSESKEVIDILDVLKLHSDAIYAHSVGVAMYSVMLARRLGHTAPGTFFKLSMAGLFHDIGKKEIDRAILQKPRLQTTVAERALIESHVVRGREILEAIKGVPSDVVQMVFEHHEDNAGLGYPRHLNASQLHPLSRILIVANRFVERAIKSGDADPLPGPQAVKYLMTYEADRLDGKVMRALASLFAK